MEAREDAKLILKQAIGPRTKDIFQLQRGLPSSAADRGAGVSFKIEVSLGLNVKQACF